MKKLVMVLALGAMLGSCGGGDAAEIDINSLDSPCGCAEAMVTILDESIDIMNDFTDLKDPSDEVRKEFQEDMKPLQDKMNAIEKKCVGDIAIEKADKDCEAAKESADKLEELMKTMRG
jgi:hypothetical protein